MSVLTLRPPAREYDPLLDKTYRGTALGVRVAEWLAYLELGGASPRTVDQYERDLARGCLMYPEHGLDVEPLFGDTEMLHVARSFNPAERRVRCAAWRSFFRWALKRRLVTLNPCDALPEMKRQPKRIYDLFTAAEQLVLTGSPIRDGALLAVMFETGARKGDCRNLRLRDWRPEATPDAPYGLVVFRAGKGGKDRAVPATEELARKLSELAILDGLAPTDFLWYTRPGGRGRFDRSKAIGDGSFDRWWRRSLEQADVRYRNPHLTRHSFATSYLRRGGRLETLQLVLGHESIQTTSDLYGHLDMRDVAFDMGLVKEVTA